MAINNPQRAFSGFHGSSEGLVSIQRIVGTLKIIGVILEPLIGIDLIEGDAGLENIDEVRIPCG